MRRLVNKYLTIVKPSKAEALRHSVLALDDSLLDPAGQNMAA
jgi:hypothetical protein